MKSVKPERPRQSIAGVRCDNEWMVKQGPWQTFI